MSQPRQQIPDGGVLPGYNLTAAAIAVALVVSEDTANVDGIQLPAANTAAIIGVTLESIAIGARGDIQRSGLAIGTSVGTITKGDRLEPDPAGTGKLQTLSTGKACGVANTSATAGQNFEFYIGAPS